jgi:hypothetical protein
MTETFTHTVYCFTDKTRSKHFVTLARATEYANKLLVLGHKCKIYPYRLPRKYVDILAERGPNG